LLFQAQDLEKEIPEKFRDKNLLNQIRSLLNSLEVNTLSTHVVKVAK